jgi:hypothetical protein
MDGTEDEIERAFVRFSAVYNGFVEGVLTMPSYEIVIDTTKLWNAFPTLREGFRLILLDEGRHITFGTGACKTLIEKRPELEQEVHDVFDAYRGNVVGLVEYQKAVPGLEVQKYQDQKVRHYRNRCREMGITPTRLIDRSWTDRLRRGPSSKLDYVEPTRNRRKMLAAAPLPARTVSTYRHGEIKKPTADVRGGQDDGIEFLRELRGHAREATRS